MSLKRLLVSLFLFLSISTQVSAAKGFHSLTIHNKTSTPLSFTIDGVCSEKLGTVSPKSDKKISAWTTHSICKECWVEINESNDCSARKLGAFYLVPSDSNVVNDVTSYQIGLVVDGGFGEVGIWWDTEN